MKKIQRLFALTTAMAMLTNFGYSQECPPSYSNECPAAYADSCNVSSYWSILIPVGALVIAGIIIATTDHHHHHHHSSSSSSHSHH